jgi:biotin synthase
MEEEKPVEIWEMIRMVATKNHHARNSSLSAGRMNMSREGQAMCFFCWCKFYFAGDKLLTTPNPDVNEDMCLKC